MADYDDSSGGADNEDRFESNSRTLTGSLKKYLNSSRTNTFTT